jgi:hypothetical protein
MTYTHRSKNEGDKFMKRFGYYFIAAIPIAIVMGVAFKYLPPETPFTGFCCGVAAAAGTVSLKDKVKEYFTL